VLTSAAHLFSGIRPSTERPAVHQDPPGFLALPLAARVYITAVVGTGVAAVLYSAPLALPQPVLFLALVAASCLTSLWSVTLPLGRATGTTLSMSYSANIMALLLLGPSPAVIVALAGAWTQCRFRCTERPVLHRTLFSTSAVALTMVASGVAYTSMGGIVRPLDLFQLARPLVGAIAAYFVTNTLLTSLVIALATKRELRTVWRDDFLWSGASFIAAGTAGALAALVIAHGYTWPALLLLAPVYLAYRTYRLFIARIDDEKRHAETAGALQRQALEARAQAEHASQIKDQFLAVVSHELRTPLNAILGWSDMLRRDTLEAHMRERAIRTIFDSATRQAQLVDDLLDIARITTGKLRIECQTVDLREPVQDALQVVQHAAEAKGVRLKVVTESGAMSVSGDAARLRQIVWNLLSNAVKFTLPGGVVTVRLRRLGTHASLTVSDTGQGIPAAFLPRVFDAFRQADASTTREQPGLGLGLSIARNLVEAHGGSIEATSDGPGRGAKFVVQLPLSIAADGGGERAGVPAARSANRSSLEGLSVLVVDDDQPSREVIAAQLDHHGAIVMTAPTAATAFDILQIRRVDLMLVDIAMPGEDGYSFIRRVRASNAAMAAIPAAALTAFAREEDRRRALDAGFALHLPKPIDPQALVAAVSTLAAGAAHASAT
jgi:signal transduction histidine kinase/CheY-like chemotaxis protein